MCRLSILIFFFFFFLGPFGIPLGRLAHLIKNSPKFEQIEMANLGHSNTVSIGISLRGIFVRKIGMQSNLFAPV
jgi:hypothetical protein